MESPEIPVEIEDAKKSIKKNADKTWHLQSDAIFEMNPWVWLGRPLEQLRLHTRQEDYAVYALLVLLGYFYSFGLLVDKISL